MNKKENMAIAQVAAIFLGTLVFVGVFSFLIGVIIPDARGAVFIMRADFQFIGTLILAQIVLATLNMILLIYLLYNYLSIYNQIKSRFALGLIVVAVAFLAYAITSNPLLQGLFGFRPIGLGPFSILPSFFTLVVTLVLIYLSKE